MALLSKETAITFLVITPLILYLFTKANRQEIMKIALVLGLITAFCLFIRYEVTKDAPGIPDTLINNSLLAATDFISRETTAIFILLQYIRLLIFPHPLSYDYSYNQVPNINLSDPLGIAAILIHFALFVYAILNLRKHTIISFGILFYLITIAPVSNIFLMIGSNKAERFLFIPSLGFCIVLTFLLMKILKADTIKNKARNLTQFFSDVPSFWMVILIIISLYSIKTFSRSKDWKDSLTLFSHDVEVADNSVRAHYNYGSSLLVDIYPKEKNKEEQNKLLDKIIVENSKAISIVNNFEGAYFNLGVAYDDKDDYKTAMKYFETTLKLSKNPDAKLYDDLGKTYERTAQYSKALSCLDSALKYDSGFFEAYNDKANVLAETGNYKAAIPLFLKTIELNPDYWIAYRNLGITYQYIGDSINSKVYLEKANRVSGGQQR